MDPATLATLAEALDNVAGGGATGVMVLLALWLYNKKNGRPKMVTEEVCVLRHESYRKDIEHIKEGVARVEGLVRNGQEKKTQRETGG